MSADNWALCPVCLKRHDEKHVALGDKATESYGKVKPEAYLELRKEFLNFPDPQETLREDYCIYIDTDAVSNKTTFNMEYRASCEICNFSYTFEKVDPIDLSIYNKKVPKKEK